MVETVALNLTEAKLDVTYTYLFEHCLNLTERDRASIKKAWGLTDEEIDAEMIRSIPSGEQKAIIEYEITRIFDFDLLGIPGFWYDIKNYHPTENPGPCDPAVWRLNLKQEHGILKPYRSKTGAIIGVYVYKNPNEQPKLLTSRGLLFGTAANPGEQ
jgi:hypothetical protein